ncbi:putative 50s ribosomal protein L33, partial [Tilletiaria anomala UBC 951]
RIIIARLLSTAGTGYQYTTRRPRTADKLAFMKYDPKVKKHVLFKETGKGGGK